jgi:hypothetical protein
MASRMTAQRLFLVKDSEERVVLGRASDIEHEGEAAVRTWNAAKRRMKADGLEGGIMMDVIDCASCSARGYLEYIAQFANLHDIKDWYGIWP